MGKMVVLRVVEVNAGNARSNKALNTTDCIMKTNNTLLHTMAHTRKCIVQEENYESVRTPSHRLVD